eukprot:724538-Amorphochlora_amoeboformis.AAC.2
MKKKQMLYVHQIIGHSEGKNQPKEAISFLLSPSSSLNHMRIYKKEEAKEEKNNPGSGRSPLT